MADNRKPGHEQFRNLFGSKAGSKEQINIPTNAQTNVRVAGTPRKASRSRPSTNNNNSKDKSLKSTKSTKNINRGRTKPSKKSSGGNRKSPGKAPPVESPHKSTKRGSKEKLVATTPPTTPRATAAPAKTNKSPWTTPTKYKGKDIPDTTIMCNTVFENDAGGIQTIGGGEGNVKLAATKIKERKLQWKKEDDGRSPLKTDPTRQSEPSNSQAQDDDYENLPSREPHIPEANVTVKARTVFENENGHPAIVKEEKEKLQWAPGAATEVSSEPAVRKKKSSGQERVRGVVSDRPPRDVTPIRLPPLPPRPISPASPRTPPMRTPKASSPVARPVMLAPTDGQQTASAEAFGQVNTEPEPEPPKKDVSCYLAPNMQAQFNSGGGRNSDLYADPINEKKQ